jgi:hypothetical protein
MLFPKFDRDRMGPQGEQGLRRKDGFTGFGRREDREVLAGVPFILQVLPTIRP